MVVGINDPDDLTQIKASHTVLGWYLGLLL